MVFPPAGAGARPRTETPPGARTCQPWAGRKPGSSQVGARRSPAELALLREASERVVDSLLATFAACAPGRTTAELVAQLRQEEERRDLTYEYCLITAGTGLNRAASAQ